MNVTGALAWAEMMKWKVRTKLNIQDISHNNKTGINDTFRQVFRTYLVIKEKINSVRAGGQIWWGVAFLKMGNITACLMSMEINLV